MSIEIIGAGLGRTGTLTLKLALEELGYSQCYHMGELLNNPKRLKYWQELYKKGETDFEALFYGYKATVDYPSASFYKILCQAYPDAKVILTVRDPEQWYESVINTIYSVSPKNIGDIIKLIFRSFSNPTLRSVSPVFRFADKLIWADQFEGRFTDKTYAIKKYNEWNEEVKRIIPQDNLLVYDVNEGWEKLCNFLDKPVPNTIFPKSNERANFQTKIDKLMKEGVITP